MLQEVISFRYLQVTVLGLQHLHFLDFPQPALKSFPSHVSPLGMHDPPLSLHPGFVLHVALDKKNGVI